MSTEESISIIKELTLLDESDSNIKALAERVDANIRFLKEMHSLKNKYSKGMKGDIDKYTALYKAVIKFKKALNTLNDLQEYMLWSEMKHAAVPLLMNLHKKSKTKIITILPKNIAS